MIHTVAIDAVRTGFEARCTCGYASGVVHSHVYATGSAHLHLAEVCLLKDKVETPAGVVGSSPPRPDETATTLPTKVN